MQALSKQIRKRFALRLYLILAVFTILIVYMVLHSLYLNILSKEESLSSIASQVAEFVISQEALGVDQKISEILDQLGMDNGVIIKLLRGNVHVGRKLSWVFPLNLEYQYTVRNFQGDAYGILQIITPLFSTNNDVVFLLKQAGIFFLILIGVFILIFPLFNKLPRELIITPIHNLLLMLDDNSYDSRKRNNFKFNSIELFEIGEKIELILQNAKRHSRDIAIGQIASQVAHDIRSPLAALNVLMDKETDMQNDQKQLLHNAIHRINDIANNLLKDNEEQLLMHFKDNKEGVGDCFYFSINQFNPFRKKIGIGW